MPTVPLNITGGSYNVGTRPQSAQITRNFYPQVADDPAAYSKYVLRSWPGLTLHSTAPDPQDRGLFVHRGVLYQIAGTHLYSISRAGAHTELATVVAGGRCIFAGFGSSVAWADNGRAFIYDGTSATEIDDTDLETPNSLAHLNQQMIYDGDGGRFVVSDVGDATAIDGLNYATAEANADDLLRVYVYEQTLYLFGGETTERWYNSGTGSPPFERIEGGIIPVGLDAIHTVASNDSLMYWLGDDREVYAASASGHQRVSNAYVSHELSHYERTSDAFGWCLTFEGIDYYVITFPTEGRTLCYQQGGQWFDLSSGGDGVRRWRANSHAYAHGRHYLSDANTGAVFILDELTYTENGVRMLRERTTGPLHGGLLGAPGKPVEMSRFELLMEVGVGDISAPTDPQIMLQISDDGGRTWSTEMWGKVGIDGDYLRLVEWHALGQFRSRMLRVRTSDAAPYSIYSAAADLELGI